VIPMAATAPSLDQIVAAVLEERLRPMIREELRALLDELRVATGAPPDELDTAEAARIAGVEPDTVRDWIKRRGLSARRPPGVREHRILRADLMAFLANPSARRPSPARGPVDLAVEAGKILRGARRGG